MNLSHEYQNIVTKVCQKFAEANPQFSLGQILAAVEKVTNKKYDAFDRPCASSLQAFLLERIIEHKGWMASHTNEDGTTSGRTIKSYQLKKA